MSVYLATACTVWRAETASPRSFLEEERPERVRITLQDSTQVIVQNPRLNGDSIVGGSDAQQDQAAALDDVLQLEVRRVDRQQTALMVVITGALVFAAYLACFGFVSPCGDGS